MSSSRRRFATPCTGVADEIELLLLVWCTRIERRRLKVRGSPGNGYKYLLNVMASNNDKGGVNEKRSPVKKRREVNLVRAFLSNGTT